MKYNKTYSFASMTVRLVSDLPIDDTEYYSKFLSDREPNATVNVICGELPSVEGRIVAKSDKKTVIANDSGNYIFTSYYDAKNADFVPYACKLRHGESVDLYVDYDGLWDKMIFNALDIPQMMVRFGSALIHCSVVEHNGKAILFSGDSGAGKSTQAELWKRHRGAKIINGDRGAICEKDGKFLVCGVPFNGTSAICNNESCEVGALVLLEHGEKNELVKLPQASAFKTLLGKTTYYEWDRESVENVLNILEKFVKAVPVFKLKCLPDESAVKALEDGYERYITE